MTTRPGTLERVRVYAARKLFLAAPGAKLAIRLTPKTHPWRTLTASTLDSLFEMTEVTLRPRTKHDTIRAKNPGRFSTEIIVGKLSAATVYSTIFYVALSAVSVHIHGPLDSFEVDEAVRLLERVNAAGRAFLEGASGGA